MPRSYWRVVFAVVGFLALTGEHPNPKAQGEQAQAQQSIANSLSNIAATDHDLAERAESPPASEPCGPYQYESNADLCAQWKAADAANVAAWFSAVSLFAVALAIYLTIQSNRIARDTAKRQLRAYVTWDGVDMAFYRDAFGKVIDGRFQIRWKNGGQTPATHFISDLNWCLTDDDLPTDFEYPDGPEDVDCGNLVIGPQATVVSSAVSKITVAEFTSVGDGEKRAHLWGWTEYTDAFGERCRTEVGMKVDIVLLEGGQHDVRFMSIGRHNGMDDCCMRPPQRRKN